MWDKKDLRNVLITFALLCAGVGAFLGGAVVALIIMVA